MTSKESSFRIAIYAALGLFLILIFLLIWRSCAPEPVLTIEKQYDSAPPPPPPLASMSNIVEITQDTTLITFIANVTHQPEIDTITTMRRIDVDGESVKLGGVDNVVRPSKASLLFMGYGMITYEADSIASWEHMYKFERTKDFGVLDYRKLDIVPQIRRIEFLEYTSSSVQLWIEYTHKSKDVKCYVNGVLYKEFTPGHFEAEAPDKYLFRQYWGITGLERGVDYTVSVMVTFEDGSIDASGDIKLRL